MSVKEHYDNHLGNFYSWYSGDFNFNKDSFKNLCLDNQIKSIGLQNAIDLGAGNGFQTIGLAELGFKVTAIDFNNQLIEELKSKIGDLPIDVYNDDIRNISNYSHIQPDLIICCGDTLPHLDSKNEIKKLIKDSYKILTQKGRLILTFRDYSTELDDTKRFIPVKSDNKRILTCFIEYFTDKVRVTDLLHENENDKWIQKTSSYYKTRITRENILDFLVDLGFVIKFDNITNRMITIIAQK